MRNLLFIFICMVFASAVNAQNIYVSTPEGTQVPATILPESETPYERLFKDISYTSKWPANTILYDISKTSPSSTITYNCHAYAWHMSESFGYIPGSGSYPLSGNPPCWMNYYEYYTSVKDYMIDGSYIRVTDEHHPGKVFWPDPEFIDHSAITTNEPGIYISKWKDGPLVKHAWNDCGHSEGLIKSQLLFYVRPSEIKINGSTTICGESTYFVDVFNPNDVDHWDLQNTTDFEFLPGTSTTNTTTVTIRPKSSASTDKTTNLHVYLASKYHHTDAFQITNCPIPVITGTTPIYYGTPQTFTASKWVNGNYYWDKSNNFINFSSTSSSSTSISAATSSSNGSVTVSIKNSSGVVLKTFDVWVGAPAPSLSFYINSGSTYFVIPNQTYSGFYPQNVTGVVSGSSGYYQFAWYVNTEDGWFNMDNQWGYPPSASTATLYFPGYLRYIPYPSVGYLDIKCVGSNPITGQYYTSYTNIMCSTCQYTNKSASASIVYPNPVDDVLTVDIDAFAEQFATNAQKQSPIFDVRLYDGEGNLLRQTSAKGGMVQFNVSNFPNGIYYLHIYDGVNSKPEIQQIIIEH